MSYIPFPAGIIFHFAGANAPSGWLLCDGSAVSRTTYAALFGVIGTDYGAGNGTTTFNLPDMRQRFIIGVAASGTGSTRAGTGGAIDHVHTGPSHTHTVASHTHSVPGLSVPALDASGLGLSVTGTSDADGAHTHTYSGSTSALDSAYLAGTDVSESVPRSGDTLSYSGSTDSGGSHTHHINISGSTGPGQSTGTGTTGTGTSGAATPATDASGTGNTGTNNPPFISCHAIIKT